MLQLKREAVRNPSQSVRDLSKFIIVAAVFVAILVPLGFCVRP